MRQLCKNCGAKIPKNSDICKKCGEPYEYIDLQLDPETEKLVQVKKPSNMIHVCILLLSVLVFAYSLFLIYSNFSDGKAEEKDNTSQSVSDSSDISDQTEPTAPKYDFIATELMGQPFSAAKAILGDQYSIKITDSSTNVCYLELPIILSTTDSELTENSVISSITVSKSANVTADITADMTFSQLVPLLSLTSAAPEVGPDSFYYAYKTFDVNGHQIKASFKFDNDETEQSPLEVILTCSDFAVQKTMGTVRGLDEGSSLNMREQPLYDADAVYQLYENDKVEILETVISDDGAEWYKVMYNDSVIGYSIAEFIVVQDGTAQEEEAISEPEEEYEESEE